MNDLTKGAKDATRPCTEVRVHINRFSQQEGNMQLTVLNTTDMAHRVQGFLDAQAAAIGVAVPANLRARLD